MNVSLSNGNATGGAGTDTLSSIENVIGGRGNDVITGSGGANVLRGHVGNDTITGGTGNDTVGGGAGDDLVVWNSTSGSIFGIPFEISQDGRDLIDGGAGVDTFDVNGNALSETFRVYTRAAWLAVAGNTAAQINANTEIVITRNGSNNASIIAELDNIEEISIGTRDVSVPGGPVGGPAGGGDTVQVFGDFTQTSLNLNTITIDGNSGNDTIDISSLQSAHRIVFKSNGGNDTIVGKLRAQDVIELAPGLTANDYAKTVNEDGSVTLTSGTHSITYVSDEDPILREHDEDEDEEDHDDDNGHDDDDIEEPANKKPVVTDDHFTVKKGEALKLTAAQLLANDLDPDGGTLSIVELDEDEHGTAVLNPDGTITFTPKAGFTGEASFTYKVADGQGGYTEGKVSIVVEKPASMSVTGSRGNDRLYGDDADDRLTGGSGHDRLDGGAGADKMWGGRGNDVYTVDHRSDRVYESSGQGVDTIKSNVSYSLSGTHVERLVLTGSSDINGTGNRLDNSLTGNAGDNVLKAGSGDDVLKGLGGHDRLHGSSGQDKLYGGSGDDLLKGGAGNDRLTGGSGQDTFVFEKKGGSDTVTDFRDGHDRIDARSLSGVDDLSDLNVVQVDQDVMLARGSDILVLKGVDASDLDNSDFIF